MALAGGEVYIHSGPLWRVFFTGGDHPADWDTFRAFGPATNAGRFDHHPLPQGVHSNRGIYYAGRSISVCVAEAFQERRTLDRAAGLPALVRFTPNRSLHLLDLRHVWPTRAGASQAISSGPRRRSQRWSRAIYAEYPVDGIAYRSSMYGGEDALALYERCTDALPGNPDRVIPMTESSIVVVLKRIADDIGYSFR